MQIEVQMCGFSGVVARVPVTSVQRAAVARMSGALVHRGPDGSGTIDTPHAVIAMRRLAVIDRDGASQPLTSADGKVAVIFNGEIYNYHELRADLAAQGYQFRTKGDGEVIVALYLRDGLRFVEYLRGMFAIAIWDGSAQRLVLARDRMGEKPLYLRAGPDSLVFASEMKAILRSRLEPFELDPVSVNLFFHHQYVPEPLTAVRGVRKLDAGHMLVVDVATWDLRDICYWRMTEAAARASDPVEAIGEALHDAVKLAVRSDVPVGVALSGGIDSSLVAALAARHRSGGVAAFSVGYQGRPPSDERAAAAAFARHLGIDFHEVELATSAVVGGFDRLNFDRDDPVADIAGAGYAAVMASAAAYGVPVMLQGQGGDELFWGYTELRAARQAAHCRDRWLRWCRSKAGSARLPFHEMTPDFRLARRGVGELYTESFAAAVGDADPGAASDRERPWRDIDAALTELICATYLRGNGIAQGDRLGMAASVELRLPLLDYRLVETVIGLRKAASDGALPPKAWLKAAARDVLPPDILERPKRGFAPPTQEWHAALFAKQGGSLIDGYLVSSGILDPAAARALARGPFPRRAIAPLSFKALVLESWARQMAAVT